MIIPQKIFVQKWLKLDSPAVSKVNMTTAFHRLQRVNIAEIISLVLLAY